MRDGKGDGGMYLKEGREGEGGGRERLTESKHCLGLKIVNFHVN